MEVEKDYIVHIREFNNILTQINESCGYLCDLKIYSSPSDECTKKCDFLKQCFRKLGELSHLNENKEKINELINKAVVWIDHKVGFCEYGKRYFYTNDYAKILPYIPEIKYYYLSQYVAFDYKSNIGISNQYIDQDFKCLIRYDEHGKCWIGMITIPISLVKRVTDNVSRNSLTGYNNNGQLIKLQRESTDPLIYSRCYSGLMFCDDRKDYTVKPLKNNSRVLNETHIYVTFEDVVDDLHEIVRIIGFNIK